MGGRHPTRPQSRWPRRRTPGRRWPTALVVPSFFDAAIGAATAVQIATTALGLADIAGWAGWLLPAGVVVFMLVAVIESTRFRPMNGVWLGGIASRVVGGTATAASTSYVQSLGAAVSAAFDRAWWLVALCAAAGGGGLRVQRSPVAADLPGRARGTRPEGIGCPRGWPCWRSSRSPACVAGGRAVMHELDVSIQPPARLKLMTTLTAVSEAEFATLRDTLQVSDSVLSKHVSALVAIGYVNSRKGIHADRRTTWISLTAAGRTAPSTHAAALRELIAGVE